ncbi:hypothetical protein [Agrococcus carbonis]|nr:hypothetical protein [Agrococcus carbonis]
MRIAHDAHVIPPISSSTLEAAGGGCNSVMIVPSSVRQAHPGVVAGQ